MAFYQILRDVSPGKLEMAVQNACKAGFTPLGGAGFAGGQYTQAVFKASPELILDGKVEPIEQAEHRDTQLDSLRKALEEAGKQLVQERAAHNKVEDELHAKLSSSQAIRAIERQARAKAQEDVVTARRETGALHERLSNERKDFQKQIEAERQACANLRAERMEALTDLGKAQELLRDAVPYLPELKAKAVHKFLNLETE